MSFYVYGRDRKTGQAAHRYLSNAATEQEARAEAEARGMEISDVVAAAGAAQAPSRSHDSRSLQATHAHEPHAPTGAMHPHDERPASGFRHLSAARVPKRTLHKEAPAATTPVTVLVTPALIVANVLLYIAMAVSSAQTPEALLNWGASYGPVTIGHEWWRLLTASFVHVGVIDLVVHMATLAYAGWVAERQFGNVAFLLIYLFAGIGGNLVAQQADALGLIASATAPVGGVIGALLALTLWHRGEIDEAVPKACMTIGFISIFVIAEFGFEFSISALIGGLMCGFAGGLALSPSVETGETATTPKLIWTAALAALLLGAVGEWSKASNHGLRGTLEVLDAAEALDRRVATQLQKARSDWQSCRSEPADVAAMIQKDILPDVHSVRTRLEQLAPYPGSIAADATKELDVMKRRETDLDARVPTAKWSPDAGSARQRGECS